MKTNAMKITAMFWSERPRFWKLIGNSLNLMLKKCLQFKFFLGKFAGFYAILKWKLDGSFQLQMKNRRNAKRKMKQKIRRCKFYVKSVIFTNASFVRNSLLGFIRILIRINIIISSIEIPIFEKRVIQIHISIHITIVWNRQKERDRNKNIVLFASKSRKKLRTICNTNISTAFCPYLILRWHSGYSFRYKNQ